MRIGYVRVSKSDGSQVLDLQKDALLNEGIEEQYIYEDLASGRKDDRSGLKSCIKSLRAGDTLIVWKLDRLGRDTKHLITLVDELGKKDIGLKVLAGAGAHIDTSTANGKLIFNIFAALAEFESELIKERTKAGLAAARARGRKGGRPRKMDKQTIIMAMTALKDPNITAREVCKTLNITTSTLYEYVNGDGTLKEAGEKIVR